jgi:hypothetical protein
MNTHSHLQDNMISKEHLYEIFSGFAAVS